MKRLLMIGVLVIMLFSMVGFSQPYHYKGSGSHAYTVWVGSENPRRGVSLMNFFPGKVTIHVGDTVTWKANAHEIHTVSFLMPGQAMPEIIIPYPQGDATTPVMFNPLVAFPQGVSSGGKYDGSVYENSGLMSTDPGQVKTFSLMFTKAGTYSYVCLVHGMMMSGEVVVVESSKWVPSPYQTHRMAVKELEKAWSQVPGVMKKAYHDVVKPVRNSDGTTTHTIIVGYESGNVMIMRFFPSRVSVKPGDTIVWKWSVTGTAPHTITFLNHNADPELVLQKPPVVTNPPLAPFYPVSLVLNPAVLLPSEAVMKNMPLDNKNYFNSGIMFGNPSNPPSFSLKVGKVYGKLSYQCLLHDTSGMVGSVYVSKYGKDDD